jgi:hypothetical protein
MTTNTATGTDRTMEKKLDFAERRREFSKFPPRALCEHTFIVFIVLLPSFFFRRNRSLSKLSTLLAG